MDVRRVPAEYGYHLISQQTLPELQAFLARLRLLEEYEDSTIVYDTMHAVEREIMARLKGG